MESHVFQWTIVCVPSCTPMYLRLCIPVHLHAWQCILDASLCIPEEGEEGNNEDGDKEEGKGGGEWLPGDDPPIALPCINLALLCGVLHRSALWCIAF